MELLTGSTISNGKSNLMLRVSKAGQEWPTASRDLLTPSVINIITKRISNINKPLQLHRCQPLWRCQWS